MGAGAELPHPTGLRPATRFARGGREKKVSAAYGSSRPELVLLNAALIVSKRAAMSVL